MELFTIKLRSVIVAVAVTFFFCIFEFYANVKAIYYFLYYTPNFMLSIHKTIVNSNNKIE